MKTIPFYVLLAFLLLQAVSAASNCSVCSRCTSCPPDVLADGFLDDIDALMQAKVQSLGYPLAIARNATPAAVTYTIQYSSGLLIVLQLSLTNMQIQLLSYSINSNAAVPAPTPAPAAPVPTYQTTSDGYYIMENFNSSKQVSEIMVYLQSVIKNNLTNFQLVGVQFTNASAILYRLTFKVLPVSSALTPILQTVLVQYIGTNNCLLIDSNYSGLSNTLAWNALDNKAILSDPFIAAINTLLLNKYANLLGKSPTIVSLALALPYYQVVYQVDSTSYSFIILYDYFQNRILQGNLTTSKSVTTYTQASSSGSQTGSSTAQSGSSAQVQSGTSSAQTSNTYTSSSMPSLIVTASTSTVSANTSTSTNTASQGPVNVPTPSTPAPTATIPASPATTSTSSSSASTLSSSSSSSTVSTSTTASSSSANGASVSSTSNSTTASQSSSVPPVLSNTTSGTYQQIAHFQSNAEVISTLSYLVSVGQNISMSQVESVQKMTNGTATLYLITIRVSSLGNVAISKNIFYQFVVQFSADGSYSLQQASYTGLNTPNFSALTIDEVKKDDNIKIIARYLLSQQFPMLSSSSQVLAVFRDIPYYQIVFQGVANTQLTFIILYSLNGSVQVLTATSRQVAPPQQTYAQAAAQAAANGQTSLTVTTTAGQSGQTVQTSQVQNNQGSQSGQTSSTTTTSQTATAVQSPITPNSQTSQTTQTTQNQAQAQIQTSQSTSQGTQISQASQVNQPVQGNSASSSSQSSVQPVLQQSVTQTQSVSTQTDSPVASPVFVQIKQVQNNSSTNTIQSSAATTSTVQQTQTQSTTTSTVGTTTQASSSTPTTTTTSSTTTTVPSTSSTATQTSTSSQYSSNAVNPSTITSSISGFNHFGSNNDQFYPYVQQGVTQINQTLLAKGYSLSQIIYKDIVYKLEGSILTILFKVQAGGLIFTYQYKGSLGSSYQLTTTAQSAIQTSSDTQNYPVDSKTIVSGGVTYQLAPSSVINQAYIQSYLDFLSSTDSCYLRSNLVGIYVNPSSPKTLFFRFRNSTQYYNIATNTVQIQRILGIYLGNNNQQSSQTTTTTSNSQTSSQGQTSQASTASNSATTQGTTSQANSQATSQSQNTQTVQNTQQAQNTQPVQTTNTQSTQNTQATTIFQNTQNTQNTQASLSAQSSQAAQNSQTVQTAPIKQSQVITITNVDPHCLCYDQDKCLKCAHRYYLNNNQCIQVPNECLSYDINTGVCVKCLPGYSLLNGLCQLDDVTAYYYEGQCFQCLGDYRLVNRKCVYAPVTDPKSQQYLQTKNPLCLSWNNGVCDECLPGTYLSSRKVCELVDPFCSLFDYTKQVCNTCNDGYALRNGRCFIA